MRRLGSIRQAVKVQATSDRSQAASYKLRATSCTLQVTSYFFGQETVKAQQLENCSKTALDETALDEMAQTKICKERVTSPQMTIYQLEVTSYGQKVRRVTTRSHRNQFTPSTPAMHAASVPPDQS